MRREDANRRVFRRSLAIRLQHMVLARCGFATIPSSTRASGFWRDSFKAAEKSGVHDECWRSLRFSRHEGKSSPSPCDHGGVALKDRVEGRALEADWAHRSRPRHRGHATSVDYPVFAARMADALKPRARPACGVLICGTGIGISASPPTVLRMCAPPWCTTPTRREALPPAQRRQRHRLRRTDDRRGGGEGLPASVFLSTRPSRAAAIERRVAMMGPKI